MVEVYGKVCSYCLGWARKCVRKGCGWRVRELVILSMKFLVRPRLGNILVDGCKEPRQMIGLSVSQEGRASPQQYLPGWHLESGRNFGGRSLRECRFQELVLA